MNSNTVRDFAALAGLTEQQILEDQKLHLAERQMEEERLTPAQRAEEARMTRNASEASATKVWAEVDNAEHQAMLDEFDYTFRDAKLKGVTPIDLGNAFGTLAAMFHDEDPALLMDADDGRAKSNPGNLLNNMHFQQSMFLGSLVRNADYMLGGSDGTGGAEYYFTRAKAQLEKAVRSNRRDEIGNRQMADAMKDLKRAKLARDQLVMWRRMAADVYEAAMGSPYTAPVQNGKSSRDASMADALSAQAADLLKSL